MHGAVSNSSVSICLLIQLHYIIICLLDEWISTCIVRCGLYPGRAWIDRQAVCDSPQTALLSPQSYRYHITRAICTTADQEYYNCQMPPIPRITISVSLRKQTEWYLVSEWGLIDAAPRIRNQTSPRAIIFEEGFTGVKFTTPLISS